MQNNIEISSIPRLFAIIFTAISHQQWWCHSCHGEQIAPQRGELGTLKFLHALWRHGARTPTEDMPNEPRKWKQGSGELTKKGIVQMYRLGLWMRKRYEGFLPAQFNTAEVFVRSSDFNRTLMSAQTLLTGLYPPAAAEPIEEAEVGGLRWQPVPVHTEPRSSDRVIFDGENCEAMKAEDERIFGSEEVAKVGRENAAFLHFLSTKSGKSPLDFRGIRYVFDPIACIRWNGEGAELPNWVNDTVWDRIRDLYDLSSYYLYNTTRAVRFRTGVLFTEMLRRMQAIEQAKEDARQRLHAYSAHDTILNGVLASFGVRPVQFPRFATLVLIELHQNLASSTNESAFVRLFYRNETDSETLWEWSISDCPAPCTLKRLEKSRTQLLVTADQMNRECGGGNSDENEALEKRERIYIALIGALSLLSASLFLYIVLGSVWRNRRRKQKSKWRRRRRRKVAGANCGNGVEDMEALLMEQMMGDEEGEDGEERGRREGGDSEEEEASEERRKADDIL